MRNSFIYHHLGLGDHFICNALVRNICLNNPEDNLNLFCKPQYITTVSFMYRDLLNLQVIKADDAKARRLIPFYQQGTIIGHEHFLGSNELSFDAAFYKQLNVPFSERWDGFKVSRDYYREDDLIRRLNLEGVDYAFVHDDKDRNFVINRNAIDENLKIVTPYDTKVDNLFDYMGVMVRAKQVHCIDSCFRLMYDSVVSKTDSKLYYHINLENGVVRSNDFSKGRLNWNIL